MKYILTDTKISVRIHKKLLIIPITSIEWKDGVARVEADFNFSLQTPLFIFSSLDMYYSKHRHHHHHHKWLIKLEDYKLGTFKQWGQMSFAPSLEVLDIETFQLLSLT